METTTSTPQQTPPAAAANGNGYAAEPQRGTEAFADGQRAHPHGRHAHAHPDIPKDLPRVRTWLVALVGLVVVAALGGLFVLGWAPRHERLAELDKAMAAAADTRPNVNVTLPKRSAATLDVVLPADVRPNQETSLFP